MAKAYFVVAEEIHDAEAMRAYGKLAGPTLGKYGAKVLVLDTAAEVVEGSWHGTQTVILEFDSFENAKAWHESEDYAPALELRTKSATCNGVILHGFETPGS